MENGEKHSDDLNKKKRNYTAGEQAKFNFNYTLDL